MPSLPSRNKNMVIAATNYENVDIKAFWLCPILFALLTLFQIFFPDCSNIAKKLFHQFSQCCISGDLLNLESDFLCWVVFRSIWSCLFYQMTLSQKFGNVQGSSQLRSALLDCLSCFLGNCLEIFLKI